MPSTNIIELNHDNLELQGGFCRRSQAKSIGFKNKNSWLADQMHEGLKYIKLMEDGKQAGFIEYTTSESSSRAVYADNYLVIHCLWVSINGKGYGSLLINKCIEDARQQNKNGVVVVTHQETSWTPSRDIYLKHGFSFVHEGPYGFELYVHKLVDAPNPYFPDDWEARLMRTNELIIYRTNQCPFVEIATENVIEGAAKLGLEVKIIAMKNRAELMELSPTPYGIFGVTYNGELVTFHRLTVHSVVKRLKALMER